MQNQNSCDFFIIIIIIIIIVICDRAWEKGPCRANNDFSV